VAHDHAERAPGRRLLRRVGAALRQEQKREEEAERGEAGGAEEERVPASDQEQQASERRAARDAEIRRDADSGVRRLVLLRWNDVGDEGLARRLAEREAEAGEAEDEQSGRRVVAGGQERKHDRGLAGPAREDE